MLEKPDFLGRVAIADRGQTVRDGIEAKRVLGQGLVQGRRALRPGGLTLL